MNLFRYIRSMLLFARNQAWVDAPKWLPEDAAELTAFLDSPSGARFKAVLINLVLRQQASALSRTSGLEYEAGFCTGQKALVAAIEGMANREQFTERGEEGADLATNQWAPNTRP